MGVSAAPIPGSRPPYRQPRLLVLVVAGGAIGTSARWEVGRALPHAAGHWPWATFAINVGGSFLLGLLLEVLLRRSVDAGWRRDVRVGVGTGILGGFTTYSTFVVETDRLIASGHAVTGVEYAVGSVAAGVLAALMGTLLARALTPKRAGKGRTS